MKRIAIPISLAVAILLLAPAAYSQGCSNATLKGAYGFQDTQDDGPGQRWLIVGLIKFDGAGSGTYVWEAWRRDDGVFNVDRPEFPITYSVSPDCTFSFTHHGDLTFSGVVVNGAKELRYVETTGLQFRSGSAVKVKDQNQQ